MSDLQDNRSPEIVQLMIVLLAVTWTSVILRCYVRFWISKAIGADDWLIVVALCSYSLFGGFVFASVHYGLGRHDRDLPYDQATKARMYFALSTAIYIASMAFVKISIGLLMLRIVVGRQYTYVIIASMILVGLWSLAEWFYVIFQCRPVQFQWDASIEGGFCTGNFVRAALAFSGMSIASDWFYALLPIPMLWRLKVNLQTKLSVGLILSLGMFASISPFVRLKYLLNIKNYDDRLYAETNALIWTIIEPGIGIICASVATFRPLLAMCKVRGFSRTENTTRGGTTGTEGPYIAFQNFGTLPPVTHSMPRDKKSQSKGRSSIYHQNDSEEYILPRGKVMKTVEIAVVHENGSGV